MSEDRSEKNRKIRHWLFGPWDESRCRVCGWPLKPTVQEGCVKDNCSQRPLPIKRADEPPDFYTDEAANALLLEAMKTCLDSLFWLGIGRWEVALNIASTKPMMRVSDSDRKAAIADAYIKWKDSPSPSSPPSRHAQQDTSTPSIPSWLKP